MKTLPFLLLAALSCVPAHANTPEKAPRVKYTGLWTNSPFTSKPPPVGPGVTANPFEDYTLTGIAPVPGGYRITIMSKKNPDVKKVLEPGVTGDFKVVSVQRNPEKTLGTTVVLSSGSFQGTVAFEPDLITLKAAPVDPQGKPNPAPPGANPNQPPLPPGADNAQRQPRPRIVPPPAPTAPAAQQQQQQPPTPNQGGGNGRRLR
jgi:hypothetical protein